MGKKNLSRSKAVFSLDWKQTLCRLAAIQIQCSGGNEAAEKLLGDTSLPCFAKRVTLSVAA